MQRQLWIFLTESDESLLIDRLASAGPVRLVRGRFLPAGADPRGAGAPLEGRDLHDRERVTHIVPLSFEAQVVTHAVDQGPFAGCIRIDEARSEILTLVRPAPEAARLGPARLSGSAHAWFGGEKLRKSQDFAAWMGQAMRLVETAWPATQFDWLRVAPGAEQWCREGGQLHYLFRPVALTPTVTAPSTPHRRS